MIEYSPEMNCYREHCQNEATPGGYTCPSHKVNYMAMPREDGKKIYSIDYIQQKLHHMAEEKRAQQTLKHAREAFAI